MDYFYGDAVILMEQIASKLKYWLLSHFYLLALYNKGMFFYFPSFLTERIFINVF